MLALLPYIAMIVQYAPAVSSMLQQATSNADITSKFTTLAPEVGNFIAEVGSALFPHSTSALQQIGGAIAAFDPNYVKWVQKSCNQLLGLTGTDALAVDGHYGPLTQAAVSKLQAKYNLKVDGIAGMVTKAAIAAAMSAAA